MVIFLKIFILVCVILLIGTITTKIINSRIKKIVDGKKSKARITSLKMIVKIKNFVLFFILIITSLFMIPELKALSWTFLSGAGIITLIIGYAAQDTLSNFFSGMGIAFSDPFEIGDFVKCVDINISGYIEDITPRHTVIRTIDNIRLIIPNSKMNATTIENYNHTDNEVCRFAEFGVSYSSDLDLALNILKEEMNKLYNPNTNGICKNVEFPKVRVIKWDSSSIIIRGWIWGPDNETAHEEIFTLNYIIKKRFEKEGIEIPYNYINIINKDNKDNDIVKTKSYKIKK